VPLVLVVWGSSRAGIGPFGPGWRHAQARRAARKVRHVVALGGETRINLLARGFREEQVEVISNGVDMAAFRPGAGDPPADLPANGPVVVSVGRMVPAKGYALLLDAWQEIAGKSGQGTLVLLGDGPLLRDLEGGIERRGLAGRVIFTGLRRDISFWLAHADAYVSSSLTEGMSNALLEAIASGLPVVATRVGGAEDVVTEGENGFLVAPGSARELAQALQRLLHDEGLRRAMGERARMRARQEFSIDVIVDRYEQLFRRAVMENGQPER
jgi:glycosyltransferase involved in cell wall biosynthesis